MPTMNPTPPAARRTHDRKQSGNVLMTLVLFLILIMCFSGLAIEAGRWFVIRAELSKAVDAACLQGARNLSNPFVSPKQLAAEFCAENFTSGAFGSVASGPGSPFYNIHINGTLVTVDGHVTAYGFLSKLVGVDLVPISSAGAAQKRNVEILLVLDRSGSMAGQPIADLKVAAKSFLDFFAETEAEDRMGLISFATSVKVERPLGSHFVTPMKNAIDHMTSGGFTNSEDAIDQANGPKALQDQTGLPPEQKVQQFVIFFSDGRPNSFRGTFKNQGRTYEAVAHVMENCDPGDDNRTAAQLRSPDQEGRDIGDALPTGDGLSVGSTCGKPTTRWMIFDSRPVPGTTSVACDLQDPALGDHVCTLASSLALQHAQELKDGKVTVFTIGLGERINRTLLEQIASSPDLYYNAPTSSQLQGIFQKVAQDIKLRLVQ